VGEGSGEAEGEFEEAEGGREEVDGVSEEAEEDSQEGLEAEGVSEVDELRHSPMVVE
jgi:hypothetical protein